MHRPIYLKKTTPSAFSNQTQIYKSPLNLHNVSKFMNQNISKFSSKSFQRLQNSTNNKKDKVDIFLCNFKNGIFMGNAKNFERHGKGILLYDDGISVIAEFYHDLFHGQNIFFLKNGSILSAEFEKDKLICAVYKSYNKIFYARYVNQLIQGYTVLIDYNKQQIFSTFFKKGKISQKKREQDHQLLNKVFNQSNLQGIIPGKHIKNINFQFKKIKNIEFIRRTNKIIIGYSKNGVLNGLGLMITMNDKFDKQNKKNIFQMIERGYYKNSRLIEFGQRIFKNGNIYIGEFQNDNFQGVGILKNTRKNNWVSGKFEKGNLIQLLIYNTQDETQKGQIMKIVQSVHKKKKGYIDKEVPIIITDKIFQKQIERIQQYTLDQDLKELEFKKEQVLKKIQQNFMSQDQKFNKYKKSKLIQADKSVQYVKNDIQKKVKIHQEEKQEKQQNNFNTSRSRKHRIFTQYNSQSRDLSPILNSSRKKIFESTQVYSVQKSPIKHLKFQNDLLHQSTILNKTTKQSNSIKKSKIFSNSKLKSEERKQKDLILFQYQQNKLSNTHQKGKKKVQSSRNSFYKIA